MTFKNKLTFLRYAFLQCILWTCLFLSSSDAFLPNNIASPLDRTSMLRNNAETVMTNSLVILNDSKSSSFFPTPGTTGSSNSGADNTNSKRNSSTKKKNNRKRGSKSTVTKTKTSSSMKRGMDLSDDEQFVEHVASQYTTKGPLGPLVDDMLLDNHHHHHLSSSPMECEHSTYLKKLSNSPALVLNADYKPLSYLPLSVWTWQEAIKAVLSGKATVVETYPDKKIRAASFEIPLPCVISLNEYVPAGNKRPSFTRRNVFLRDEYKCQYCTNRFQTSDLSLDHVVPRCMGGVLSWENAVTSCLKCNGKKGSLTLPQLRSIGMKLCREPFVPTQYELAARASRMVPRKVHPVWAPYLGLPPKVVSSSNGGGDAKHSSKYRGKDEEWYFEDAL